MLNLAVEGDHLALQRHPRGLRLSQPHVPRLGKHVLGQIEQRARGLQAAQQGIELALQPLSRDRLARARAGQVMAEVVGMLLAGLAGRPAGGERVLAVGAQDEAPEGKILVDVLASGNAGTALQSQLDLLVGLKGDEALVEAFAQRDVPVGDFHVAGIGDAGQHVADALGSDLAVRQILGEVRLALEEALDLDLAVKAARCVSLQRLLDDRGKRLVADQHLAVSVELLVREPDRRLEHPVAAVAARLHAVEGLFGVLAALMLRHRSENIFVQLAIGIVAQLDRGRFKNATGQRDRSPQFEMHRHTAGKA